MAAVDGNASKRRSLNDPPENAAAVTTSDTADLANVTKALYIGVAGDVKVDMADTGTVTFKAVPVGLLAVRVKRVYATGTAATNILAFW